MYWNKMRYLKVTILLL